MHLCLKCVYTHTCDAVSSYCVLCIWIWHTYSYHCMTGGTLFHSIIAWFLHFIGGGNWVVTCLFKAILIRFESRSAWPWNFCSFLLHYASSSCSFVPFLSEQLEEWEDSRRNLVIYMTLYDPLSFPFSDTPPLRYSPPPQYPAGLPSYPHSSTTTTSFGPTVQIPASHGVV